MLIEECLPKFYPLLSFSDDFDIDAPAVSLVPIVVVLEGLALERERICGCQMREISPAGVVTWDAVRPKARHDMRQQRRTRRIGWHRADAEDVWCAGVSIVSYQSRQHLLSILGYRNDVAIVREGSAREV